MTTRPTTDTTATAIERSSMHTTDIADRPICAVAAQLLRAAADRISRCGLFQGEYWPVEPGEAGSYVDGDPCCALGALAVAAAYDDALLADSALDTRPELVTAIDALALHIDPRPARHPVVSAWNDLPGRTAAEVIAALRGAAESLDPDPPDPPPVTPVSSSVAPGGPSAKSFHQAGASTPSTHKHSTSQGTADV